MLLPKCIRSSEICDIVPLNYCVLGGKLQYWNIELEYNIGRYSNKQQAELNIIYLSLNSSPLKL